MSIDQDNRELAAPRDELKFDEAALAAYLKEHIDGFAGDCEIQQFLGGQSNPTYLIEDSSGTYVLRKKPPGKLLPSAHAVDREYRVITALADSSVPVPKTHVLCTDESVIGQIFYVMDYVPGRVIVDNYIADSSKEDRTAIYHSMAEVFGALHSADYLALGLETFGKPTSYVARQVSRWTQQYEASKVEECAEMDELMRWLPENNPDDDLSSIVHGDYRLGNLIVHPTKPEVVAVLDWELSTIGHPLADLGYFMMPYRLEPADAMTGIKGVDLESLGIPDESALLETYAKAAGLDEVRDLDFYIVFAMFRLCGILAGVLKRGLDGNAADPRAVERGRTYQRLAKVAWDIANKS